MPETNTSLTIAAELIQGRMIIMKKHYHGAIHAMIIPDENPGDWFIRQFPIRELALLFAQENHLAVSDEE